MKLLYALALAVSLVAQTVEVAAQSGGAGQSARLTVVPKSTTTFGLSSATGAAILNLSAATTRPQVQSIALGFTVNWIAADASAVSVSMGPALSGTGKTLACTPGASFTTCTISGGTATIPDGVVAVIGATVNKTTTLTISAATSTNKFGVPLLTAITPGGTVTAATTPLPAPLLASLTCASAQIEPGEDVVCAATLVQAAPSNTTVALVSSTPAAVGIFSPAGTATTTLIIASGSLTGNFILRGL